MVRADGTFEGKASMNCPTCGVQNDELARFCQKCGQTLAPSRVPPAVASQAPPGMPYGPPQQVVSPAGAQYAPAAQPGAQYAPAAQPGAQYAPAAQPTMRGMQVNVQTNIVGPDGWRSPQQRPIPGGVLVLSLFVPGAGQFFNRDIKKGILLLVIAFLTGFETLSFGWWALGVLSLVDANNVAKGKWRSW